jgi:hypothetical protein
MFRILSKFICSKSNHRRIIWSRNSYFCRLGFWIFVYLRKYTTHSSLFSYRITICCIWDKIDSKICKTIWVSKWYLEFKWCISSNYAAFVLFSKCHSSCCTGEHNYEVFEMPDNLHSIYEDKLLSAHLWYV